MDGQDSDDSKQSTADMTVFVQNLLTQMQSRFQAMSESIVSKNLCCACKGISPYIPPLVVDLVNKIDDMGQRIDELEQSINELRNEMGTEGGSPSPLAPTKAKEDDSKPASSSP